MSEPEPPQDQPLLQTCPNCATLIDVGEEEPFAQIHCPICGQAMRARTQFNNFELLEKIGSGGMGAVFKARDVNLNRLVALKVIRKEYCQNPEYIAKFETEAQITASVNHPYVVKVFSFGQDHGQFYIAMELVDKGSLDDLISLQGRVAEAQVLEVGLMIAQGLKAAHEAGLIHRDVKPGNILFADAHTAKIVDFGLALLAEEEATARGEVWGTPYYVAPEKLNQEPEDFRSDIYSLGGTLFHALAGRPPFEAETASLVALKHIKSRAVSLQAFAPDISSPTAYVINRMLDKDPNQRYQSYDELIEHLTFARTKLLESAGRLMAQQKRVVVDSEQEQKAIGWILVGVLALLLIVGGVLFAYRDKLFGGPRSRAEIRAQQRKVQTRRTLQESEQQFADAREAITRGDYASAEETLRAISQLPGLRDPLRTWVALHEGLVLFLQEREEDARRVFRKILNEKNAQGSTESSALNSFFLETSRQVAESRVVPGAAIRNYNPNQVEIFAVLIFGLVDWNRKEFDNAALLLGHFAKADPPAPHQWIADYKLLAAKYELDSRLTARLMGRAKTTATPEAQAALVREIEEEKGKLQIGGKAQEALDELAASLQGKQASVKAANEQQAKTRRETETRLLREAEKRTRSMVTAMRFQQAIDQLKALQISHPDVVRLRNAALQRISLLKEFQQQLGKDIVAMGTRLPLTSRAGETIAKGTYRVENTGIRVRSKYGESLLEWEKVAPASLLELAKDFIQRSPDETSAARRKWLAGAFAWQVLNEPAGRQMMIEASQANNTYRDQLTLFFESAN